MSIRPIVLRADSVIMARSRESTAIGRAENATFISVCVMAAIVTIYACYHVYLFEFEKRSPSGHVYLESEGSRVYLVQPVSLIQPQRSQSLAPDSRERQVSLPRDGEREDFPTGTTAVSSLPDQSSLTSVSAPSRLLAPPPRTDVPLPPVALEVAAIDVSVPIRIVQSDSLPSSAYAGWLFRSAFPATAGNMVLLGHVDGPAAVFDRLGELTEGDEVRIDTATATHVYVVEWTAIVDSSAVEMLGPIEHPVLTLVTCFGEWNVERRSYDSRLIVRARYLAIEDRSERDG